MKTIPVPLSTGGTSPHNLHWKRREALNPYFTRKSVVGYEPAIEAKVQQLDGVLERYRRSGKPLNLSDVLYGFTTESVKYNVFLSLFCFDRNMELTVGK